MPFDKQSVTDTAAGRPVQGVRNSPWDLLSFSISQPNFGSLLELWIALPHTPLHGWIAPLSEGNRCFFLSAHEPAKLEDFMSVVGLVRIIETELLHLRVARKNKTTKQDLRKVKECSLSSSATIYTRIASKNAALKISNELTFRNFISWKMLVAILLFIDRGLSTFRLTKPWSSTRKEERDHFWKKACHYARRTTFI